MKEIRFRGQSVTTGEWLEGYYAYKRFNDEHYIIRDSEGVYGGYFIETRVVYETVEQFVGYDARGNEVYERISE